MRLNPPFVKLPQRRASDGQNAACVCAKKQKVADVAAISQCAEAFTHFFVICEVVGDPGIEFGMN